jgi:hypothetical protein
VTANRRRDAEHGAIFPSRLHSRPRVDRIV